MALNEISPVTGAAPVLAVMSHSVAVSPSSTQPAAAVSKAALVASSPTTASAPLASAPRASVTRRSGRRGRDSTQPSITDTYTTSVSEDTYSGSEQQNFGGNPESADDQQESGSDYNLREVDTGYVASANSAADRSAPTRASGFEDTEAEALGGILDALA